jgi:hypothetical protein
VADTQTSARHQGAFKTSSVNWTCKGMHCSAAAMPAAVADPLSTCQELAREVGALHSFKLAGHALTATELQQCNSGSTPNIARAQKRTVTADDFSRLAQPLPDAPHRVTLSHD